jgi:hypothetical protein
MQGTARKRGGANAVKNNVDVEDGNGSSTNKEDLTNQNEEEREELLARYFRRRAKDIHDMVSTGNFYGIIDTLRPLFDGKLCQNAIIYVEDTNLILLLHIRSRYK